MPIMWPRTECCNSVYIHVTKMKPDPYNFLSLDMEKSPADFYQTPTIATKKLLENERFRGRILEPACGEGAISKVLTQNRYKVDSYDLHDYGFGVPGVDFLGNRISKAVNIVTNVPYSIWEPFTRKCLDIYQKKLCLIFPLRYLEGKTRSHLFEETYLTRVYVFSFRIGFLLPGRTKVSKMIAYAWYVWEKGHEGPPTIHWLHKE